MHDILDLATQVGKTLREKGLMLATAESCTGGGVAQAITEIPGSSEWFDGGFIAYSNACKTEMLSVVAAEIAKYGAVSEEIASAMASGALANTQADVAIATTGIAGPTGAVPGKPVGTVCIACAANNRMYSDRNVFSGDRQAVRQQTIVHVLQTLLKFLQDVPAKSLPKKAQ
ncbi:MAG: CinA family protein [Oxalobacter sp.]|nr:MAG: CinA family protein [Oxalobacter sp.]